MSAPVIRALSSDQNVAMAISTRNRLDDLPAELRNLLVNFTPLSMRAVLALVPQFRIRSDDVLRGRKLLCEWAAGEGYLDLLKWAHQRDFPLLQLLDGRGACAAAARGGHLAVLQWLRQIRCCWDTRTCYSAAEGGHLEVLQWARANGCPWNSGATTAAARGGHMHVLQWLRSQRCEWSAFAPLEAARRRHWEVLEWEIANGCPVRNANTPALAFCTGQLPLVEWALKQEIWVVPSVSDAPGLNLQALRSLKEQRPDLLAKHAELRAIATRQLARVGDLVGLQWARQNGFFNSTEVGRGAAEGGQLAVLQWAKENSISKNLRCDVMAHAGHLECLKWALANGQRLSPSLCSDAAGGGSLSVLQWLREIGCEWDGDTLAFALEAGHWEVFEWVRQHGCPLNARVFEEAVRGGYAEVLHWAFEVAADTVKPNAKWLNYAPNPQVLKVLRDHGCEWDESTCAELSWQGDLELLQWAVRNGCPWNQETSRGALEYGTLYAFQWAVENGCPMDDETRRWWSTRPLEKEFEQPHC